MYSASLVSRASRIFPVRGGKREGNYLVSRLFEGGRGGALLRAHARRSYTSNNDSGKYSRQSTLS